MPVLRSSAAAAAAATEKDFVDTKASTYSINSENRSDDNISDLDNEESDIHGPARRKAKKLDEENQRLKAEICSKLPFSTVKLFGKMGFAYYSQRSCPPAYVVPPYEMPEAAARDDWLEAYEKKKEHGRSVPLLINWYGEPKGSPIQYSLIPPNRFVPYEDATPAMLNYARSAQVKQAQKKRLSAPERKRLLAMKHLQEDLAMLRNEHEEDDDEEEEEAIGSEKSHATAASNGTKKNTKRVTRSGAKKRNTEAVEATTAPGDQLEEEKDETSSAPETTSATTQRKKRRRRKTGEPEEEEEGGEEKAGDAHEEELEIRRAPQLSIQAEGGPNQRQPKEQKISTATKISQRKSQPISDHSVREAKLEKQVQCKNVELEDLRQHHIMASKEKDEELEHIRQQQKEKDEELESLRQELQQTRQELQQATEENNHQLGQKDEVIRVREERNRELYAEKLELFESNEMKDQQIQNLFQSAETKDDTIRDLLKSSETKDETIRDLTTRVSNLEQQNLGLQESCRNQSEALKALCNARTPVAPPVTAPAPAQTQRSPQGGRQSNGFSADL